LKIGLISALQRRFLVLFLTILVSQATNAQEKKPYKATGMASFYADKFVGRKTSSGEIFDKDDFTCAHRTLPFGTRLTVVNPITKTAVVVRVNDRGPHHRNRIIDLSQAAARELGIMQAGSHKVFISTLEGENENEHLTIKVPEGSAAKWEKLPAGKLYSLGKKVQKPKGFTVQISAYHDAESALYDSEALKAAGLGPASIEIVLSESGKLFRVLGGNWAKRKDAESRAADLEAAGFGTLVRSLN
jgi:rare lipoprotein A